MPLPLLRRLALAACAAASFVLSSPAGSTPLRVATWNLGWHVSQAELGPWIAQCAKPYARDDATGVWRVVPAGTPGARPGWEVDESRATLEGVDLAVMPPCGVYRAARAGIAVTPAAWAKRNEQIATVLRESVRADVIAFQEVSGVAAVREALGAAAADYEVCSFDGRYKVQRLAFAWKKSFGAALGPCEDHRALSLPELPPKDQVRPGFTLTLQIAGRKIRFLTVHLKSSCVSPLDRGQLDGNTGPNDPCPILQQQVAPLEAIVEALPEGVDHVVVLGDFNRNLAHEAARVAGAEPVRSDGSRDLARPRPAGVTTRNLLAEVNDAQPPASALALLSPACPGPSEVAAACTKAKTGLLSGDERRVLGDTGGLGCRNAIGLDHILVSDALVRSVTSTAKVPLGLFGRSLQPRPPQDPEPTLAVSDHCPLVAELDL